MTPTEQEDRRAHVRDRYPVVRTSAKAVVLHCRHLLLVRAVWEGRDCYFLPGGGQHPGENLADAARREVYEGTGLTVTPDRLLWVRGYIGANHEHAATEAATHRIETVFLRTPTGDPHRLGGQDTDTVQIGLAWVPLEKVPSVDLLPHALRTLIAALANPGEVPAGHLGGVA
ncbi:NUDIX domain-containing protein [Streptomyces sp. CNQ085]|uniref:NUDIX domain-containing protein n=1 Tax=Streptomyces sp. CNQ085 TaxID=2886944 RepID=UPI0027E50EC6|nr:NUDIX domain-containing protein [Streptomyces sp. CNQ085]MCI0385087.1 NUDIX domain-containing protein [Streptomyces sp. CNQ085]